VEVAAYLLCTATALACAALLWRGYRRNGVRLLFWSAVCFLGLTLENAILFIDRILVGPEVDLSLVRLSAAIVGVAALLYGLVWEKR
jgi:hypothetical protein